MRKNGLLGLLAATGVAAIAVSELAPAPAQNHSPSSKSESGALPASGPRPLAMPVREALGRPRGDLFSPLDWAPPKPALEVVSAPPAAPSPPPMPYRAAGQLIHDGKAQVVLAKDQLLFTVQQGDTLDGGYRVQSIEANRVVLVYTPLGAVQHLPIVPLLAPQALPTFATEHLSVAQQYAAVKTGPAQLRWLGPERVFAGSPFEVVLKLTSAQPIHSSPLELSYDAKLLEAVAVRAGDFFAGGKFSYRVAPSGSILIGATNQDAVAADVDFLIVTFKAIRAGATAELKLSFVELKDGAGGAVEHVPPAAFRTSIIR